MWGRISAVDPISFRAVFLILGVVSCAAAALQGAPVTTMDFDFVFRKTPANLRKLKRLAASLVVLGVWEIYF